MWCGRPGEESPSRDFPFGVLRDTLLPFLTFPPPEEEEVNYYIATKRTQFIWLTKLWWWLFIYLFLTFFFYIVCCRSRSGYDTSSGEDDEVAEYEQLAYQQTTVQARAVTHHPQGKHINKGRWTKEEVNSIEKEKEICQCIYPLDPQQ